jgi:outer membrane biosynthesis protein TonB
VRIDLVRSSGSRLLDDAGFQAVKRAAPFQPFPAEIASDGMVLTLIFPMPPQRP